MNIEKLFGYIFQHPELIAQPPVLVDIGASGNLHGQWQKIAQYAICIAFDADDRDMGYISEKAKNFRQLHIINKIVTDIDELSTNFYLTSSPYCSSLLAPDTKSLAEWRFKSLFETEKIIKLKSTSLKKALDDLNITYVDWFKSDSQGLDMRLFKNIGQVQLSTIVADFEPGFIDAYIGEDKIVDLLAYMANMPFWLSNFTVCGNQRVIIENLKDAFNQSETELLLNHSHESPIFAEITYLNNFKQPQLHTERNYLLGCAFTLILKQYAFASELALSGLALSGNNVFNLILQYIKQVTAKPTVGILFTQPALAKQKIVNRIIAKLQKLL